MSAVCLCCLFLVITYAAKAMQLNYRGYWVCVLVTSEMQIWSFQFISCVNMPIIAVERYVMAIHPIWHRNHWKLSLTYLLVIANWSLK